MNRRNAEPAIATARLRARLLPPVALTLISAASMALEIVAGRALAPFVGMSLYSWTVIIAVVLAGLSLGHWIGGAIADRTTRPERWAAGTLTAAAITAGGSLGLLRLVEPSVAGFNPVGHAGALALVAFFAPSALAGMLSPLLTVMALDIAAPARRGRVLGLMYALGAFGAIIGTLAAGLVLISWIGTTGSVLLVGALYGALSLAFWARRAAPVATAALAVAAGAGLAFPERSGLAAPCLEESAYFCIRADDTRFLGREARVMALDHLAHGVNDAENPLVLLTPYVQGVDEIVRYRLGPEPFDAFFIGGGAYSLPRAWSARFPGAKQMVAELDPRVTDVAGRLFWIDPAALDIRHEDARALLARLPGDQRFDVIFGDAFLDIAVPPHLVTDEFNALVAERLAPGGIYALNVVDSLREPLFLLSLAETLRARFRSVELWLFVDEFRPGDHRTTWIVIASDTPTDTAEVRADTGFDRTWLRVPLPQMVAAVGPARIVRLTDDYAPVDRLMSPLLLSSGLAGE